MKKYINLWVLFLIFLFSSPLSAEAFRVRKTHIAKISEPLSDEIQVTSGINDAVGILLPNDKTFLEGIEIKMTIPESIIDWRDSVAISIYEKTSPNPAANYIDYSGTRIFVHTLPARLSWIVKVPLSNSNSIKENQYSAKVDTIPNISANNIFMRFQPVMKGIPEETMRAEIGVSVRPILMDKGRLLLKLKAPDTDILQHSVFIDDKPVDTKKDILLSTGVHNLSIISENYRNEVRTFYIEQAKNTELLIELKSVEPTLLIFAPVGTSVVLDDKECNEIGKEFEITEGEHVIKFSIGNYEVVRTINASKGKTYKANFEVDLTISDGEE